MDQTPKVKQKFSEMWERQVNKQFQGIIVYKEEAQLMVTGYKQFSDNRIRS